ncbi:MAG: hypothetical protein IKP95_05280 [Ruminococcus sp.]|nr:hypothetical protein [Ruminococcus sp.]
MEGSTAGIYAFSSNTQPKTEEAEDVKQENSSEKGSGIISGGGTVTSSQLSDQLGLKNTSVRLTSLREPSTSRAAPRCSGCSPSSMRWATP